MKMNEWIDLVRASVRPFIIIWGFIVYGVCVMKGTEVPPILVGLVTAVVIAYFGERAVLRFRDK